MVKVYIITILSVFLANSAFAAKDISLMMHEEEIRDARESFKKKDFADAEIKSRNVINKDPEYYPAYNMLGSTYAAMNRPEEAIAFFERSLDINPDQDSLYDKLSFLCNKAGDMGKAVSYLKKSAEMYPNDPKKQYKLGFIYFVQMKDPENAQKHFLAAEELMKDDVSVLYFLGATYLLDNNMAAALEYVSKLRDNNEQFLSAVLEDFIKRKSAGQDVQVDNFSALYNKTHLE